MKKRQHFKPDHLHLRCAFSELAGSMRTRTALCSKKQHQKASEGRIRRIERQQHKAASEGRIRRIKRQHQRAASEGRSEALKGSIKEQVGSTKRQRHRQRQRRKGVAEGRLAAPKGVRKSSSQRYSGDIGQIKGSIRRQPAAPRKQQKIPPEGSIQRQVRGINK